MICLPKAKTDQKLLLLENCLANNLPTKSKNWPKIDRAKIAFAFAQSKSSFCLARQQNWPKTATQKAKLLFGYIFEQFLLPWTGQFPDLLRIRRQKLLKNCPAPGTDQKLPSKKQFCYQKAKLLFGPKLVGKIIDQKLLGSFPAKQKQFLTRNCFCLRIA